VAVIPDIVGVMRSHLSVDRSISAVALRG
jgi:hypothetical protein